ncbi:MAG: 16S rRNA processing protein RimM [Coriobacteriaceae bacterium]|nr:16S rRNA processing protein RimM [Coriobacteriaceae bacterium]
MDGPSFVPVARVVKAHGLSGEFAVIDYGDLEALMPGIEVWFVPPPASARSGRLLGVRPGPKGPLATVAGIDSIAAAREVAGTEMVVRPADIPEDWLTEVFDPVGVSVTDESRGALGTVQEVIVTGANDVWVVRGPLGEVLLPVIEDVVLEIDEERRHASVRLLPGLLPDDEEEPA